MLGAKGLRDSIVTHILSRDQCQTCTMILFVYLFIIFLSYFFPFLGKRNKVVITVAGSEKVIPSSLRLDLITPEGTKISDVTLQTADRVHFTSSFTPRVSQPFKFKLRGTTRGGNAFERISHQTIKPTTVVLRGKYASNEIGRAHV